MEEAQKYLDELKAKIKKLEWSPIRKLGLVVLFSSILILIISYISAILGNDFFLLPQEVNDITLDIIVSTFLFLLSNTLIYIFSFNLPIKKTILIGLGYLPIYLLSEAFNMSAFFITILLPFIYALSVIIINELNIKKSLAKYMIIFTLGLGYQILSGFIKIQYEINIIDNSLYSIDAKLWYSLDIFLFYIVLIIIVKTGGKTNALVSTTITQEISTTEVVYEDEEELEVIGRFNNLPKYRKIFIMIGLFSFQVGQMIILLGICLLNNTIIEILIILPGFWLSRIVLKRSWHSNSAAWCTTLSLAVFYAASKITVPAHYSMLFPIIVGVLIGYALYRAAIYIDEYNAMKRKINN